MLCLNHPTSYSKVVPLDIFLNVRRLQSVVLLTLHKIEVHLDFHIFDILDLDLFLDYPLESFLTSHQGSLDDLYIETASATATSCLENLMAKFLPVQNPLEEMMHISPFVSYEPILFEVAKFSTSEEYVLEDTLHFSEDERLSSPSIEFEPLLTGPEYAVLDHDQESTLIFDYETLEMENP